MSQVFSKSGELIPVTILNVEENAVVFAKEGKDRSFVQLAAFEQKQQRLSKSVRGVFAKANVTPKKIIKEFTVDTKDMLKIGDLLGADFFKANQFVDVTGKSVGKGFAGVMKRHNFKGLEASHGVSVSHRSAGSTGQCQDPGRVFKGKKMAGRLGGVNKTVQNVEIIEVDLDLQLLILKGSVPGNKGGYLFVKDAVKK
jgi:large subunit ribosomal protein L3